ncbi:pentapeptide repeat-containing protein [Paenibacillus lautus]
MVFKSSDLSTAKFEKCNLSNVDIKDCNIEGLSIDGILLTDLLGHYK